MAGLAVKCEHASIPTVTLEEWAGRAEEAHRRAMPVVIAGARRSAGDAWTPGFLAREFADMRVPVTVNLPEHGVPYAMAGQSHHREMRIADFVAMLEQGVPCYMNQVALKHFPAYVKVFDFSGLRVTPIRAVNVWVGAATKSGLHFDGADNLFAQMYGRKRALLFSPSSASKLYPFPDNPSKSQVDPERPDLERHPRFTLTTCLTYELEPGDLLYIPRGWWHYLAADDVSISVNTWHGRGLLRRERLKLYSGAGPKLVSSWLRGFFLHGMLKHPYENRLFSPPPLGVQSYQKFKKALRSNG
jgi:Cupin-like domain